jgi:hypothetical protein
VRAKYVGGQRVQDPWASYIDLFQRRKKIKIGATRKTKISPLGEKICLF